jgi:hypothetical protein
MQAIDVEMPIKERPTTLKKLIKRYFKNFENFEAELCSTCKKPLKILERRMTHFPNYLTVLLKRETRISGVRALSNRIVEVPLLKTYKILG